MQNVGYIVVDVGRTTYTVLLNKKNSKMNIREEILNELMDTHRSIIELLNYDTTIPVLTGVREIQKNLLNIQNIISNENK